MVMNNNDKINNNNNKSSMMSSSTKKMKILCLHGRQQSAAMMSNKIAGARKKLQRVYELDFLDAPFEIIEQVVGTTSATATTTTTSTSSGQQQGQQQQQQQRQLEWWTSSNCNTNSNNNSNNNSMKEAYEYVIESTKDKNYDAIIGFSQGGLLGTAMVSLGYFPTVRAVVTAGSPYRKEPFDIINKLMDDGEKEKEGEEGKNNNNNNNILIPKFLHFAGETDIMVPIESTQLLCEHGGNGRVIIHEKGHLFPTKAIFVNEMLDFLKLSLE
jgi:predicted esterase